MKQEIVGPFRSLTGDIETIFVPEPGEELTMGIPSKNSLYKGSVNLLKDAKVEYKKLPLQLTARAWFFEDNQPIGIVNLVFSRPRTIAQRVLDGDLDLGIVGEDTLTEFNYGVKRTEKLNFGKCELVLAVSKPFWLAREKYTDDNRRIICIPQDLQRLRIGTSYLNLTQQYFDSLNIPVSLIYQEGAVEGMIKAGWADGITDLKTSGKTLKENKLIEIATIYESQATLITNESSVEQKGAIKFFNQFVYRLIEANRKIQSR